MGTQKIWYHTSEHLGVSWAWYSRNAVINGVRDLANCFDCSQNEIWEHIETAIVPAGTFPKRGHGELHAYIPDIAV